MKRRLAHAALVTACTTALALGLPSTGDACLFGLFGCHGGCGYGYGGYSGCNPCYSAGYAPMQSYYAPSYSYAPACNPCGSSCSPCGVGCSPCAGGSCAGGVCDVPASRGDGWRRTPAGEDEPRTFEDDPGALGPPPADATPPDDAGFGRESSPFGDPNAEPPGDIETRRPPTEPEDTSTPQRKPAPSPSPLDDENGPATDATESGNTAPASVHDTPAGPEFNVLALGLDQRLTARTRPVHTRLQLRSAFSSPTVVRNFDWPARAHDPSAPVMHIVRN